MGISHAPLLPIALDEQPVRVTIATMAARVARQARVPSATDWSAMRQTP